MVQHSLSIKSYSLEMCAGTSWNAAHKVPRFHVTLPSKLLRVNVHMPALYVHRLLGVPLLGCSWQGRTLEHRSERLGHISGVEVMCDNAARVGVEGRRRRSTGDEDIMFDSGRENTK